MRLHEHEGADAFENNGLPVPRRGIAETVEDALRQHLEEFDIKPGKLMGAMRTALTGQGVGPDFMHVVTLLGQQRVVKRLAATVAQLNSTS